MDKEGKYIYCITEISQERNFGPIGIGERGDEVLTIGYDDLSMVVSSCPMATVSANSENILSHQKVIEKVMNEFDSVLPVRFGTVASSADEVRNLLDRRYREFKSILTEMDHKVELGVKGMWRNMIAVFDEVVQDNKDVKALKRRIADNPTGNNTQAKIEIGKMVECALQSKKEQEAQTVVDALRRTAFDHKLNKTAGDEMFMNAAFLVSKGREKEFDNIMDDLSDEYEDRAEFAYTGPLPAFNFVNMVIYPEEWEN